MTVLSDLSRRTRFRIVTYISTRPKLYFGVRRLSRRLDPLCIRPETDIVIEGFPRSANSTTVHRFLARQDRSLHVAHHKHHAAQILRAAEWGIPAVVLIREPKEACLSLLALGAEARHRAGKPPSDSLESIDVFLAYVGFYEAVEKCLDKTVIGRFEFVCTDIENLVNRVNARFGTDFRSEEVEMTPQPRLGWHAMPNDIRERIKQDLEAKFLEELAASSRLQHFVSKASAIHARYCKADERSGQSPHG